MSRILSTLPAPPRNTWVWAGWEFCSGCGSGLISFFSDDLSGYFIRTALFFEGRHGFSGRMDKAGPHAGVELRRREGFSQKIRGAQLKTGVSAGFVTERGQHHDGQLPKIVVR